MKLYTGFRLIYIYIRPWPILNIKSRLCTFKLQVYCKWWQMWQTSLCHHGISMSFWLENLPLTMDHYKNQYQGHTHLGCNYLVQGDPYINHTFYCKHLISSELFAFIDLRPHFEQMPLADSLWFAQPCCDVLIYTNIYWCHKHANSKYSITNITNSSFNNFVPNNNFVAILFSS